MVWKFKKVNEDTIEYGIMGIFFIAIMLLLINPVTNFIKEDLVLFFFGVLALGGITLFGYLLMQKEGRGVFIFKKVQVAQENKEK